MRLLALLLLVGCTTPEMACDMRANYEQEIPPWTQGTVTVRWQFNAELPQNVNGTSDCWGLSDARFCVIRMKGPAASFNSVCGLAKEMHELHHAQGAKHER